MDGFLIALALAVAVVFTVYAGFRTAAQMEKHDWKGAFVEGLLVFIGAVMTVKLIGWLGVVL